MSDIILQFHNTAEATGLTPGELFERAVQKIYEAWLREGDHAVDVGANRGRHLFPMAECVGAKGKVYAFEPIPKSYKRLKRDIKKRQLNTIKLHPLALGQQKGLVSFSYFEKHPTFSGLQKRETPFNDEDGGLQKIDVQCATLDSKLPWPWRHKISAIKLDIEGGELHALMGAEKCLTKSRPMLVFENGRQQAADAYGYSENDFYDFFDRMNMQVFWLDGAPFTRACWNKDIKCWEFVALPSEKADWAKNLPELCKQVLAEAEA